jgi:molecular chaperone DnaK
VPQVEVTFDIDANGIVNVSARDKATAKEQSIRIQANGGLSDADIDQMVRDAEKFAEEDKKRRESAEARNNADSLAYQCEKQLKELGDKIPADKKSGIEAAVDSVREALKGDDVEAVKTAYSDLQNKFQAASEEIYKAGAAGAAPDAEGASQERPSAGSGKPKKDGDVVDAEFEVVDDDKKK